MGPALALGLAWPVVLPQADSPTSAIMETANRAGRFIFPPSETRKRSPTGSILPQRCLGQSLVDTVVEDGHHHAEDQHQAPEEAEVAEELEKGGVTREVRATLGADQDHRDDAADRADEGQEESIDQPG